MAIAFVALTAAQVAFMPMFGVGLSYSTGKAAGSFYYLQQYLREQSQTRVATLKLPSLPFPLEPAGGPPPGCRLRRQGR